ncbi:MAG: hypothetical protein ACI9QD_000768 [Thermoproteota archaeon]|jgi:hypothetical protein
MSNKNETQNWTEKFQDLLGVCQEEIKKTTAIGKKMLDATTSNSKLHNEYEELGRLCLRQIEEGFLVWENEDSKEIIESIKSLELELNSIENDVKEIKKVSSL